MKARIGNVPARFRRNRFRTALVAFVGAAAPVASLLALQKPGEPVGGETFTTFSAFAGQYRPQVAVDADGDAVVVFDGRYDDSDGDGFGVKVLKIDAHGRFIAPGGKVDPDGEPRTVNTTTTGTQRSGAVAMDRDGDFVVTWMGGPAGYDTYDIYFQRYDKAFQPVGAEVKVTTRTTRQTFSDPAVAMDADGDFVITWIDSLAAFNVRAQRFLADGSANGAPFNVSNQTGYQRSQPRIAMDAQGNFAVAWTSQSQDGDQEGVFMRAFDASGTPRANEIVVNSSSGNSQAGPDIAMDRDGDFVVVWNDVDGQYFSIVYFQRFDATGAAVGTNSFVTDDPNGDEHRPSVSMADNGDFAVAWNGYSSDPPPLGSEGFSAGVLARRFGKDGTPVDVPFRVNLTTPGTQKWGDVALDADGDLAVAYASYYYIPALARPAGGVGTAALPSGTTMLFRRFTGSEPVDVQVREVPPATAEVVVDGTYAIDLTIKNRHAAAALEGIGAATGIAVDLVSDQGSFLGIDQPGWECGTASFCVAAGFCLTCIADDPVPAGGNLTLTVNLQAPPDVGTVTTSVAANLNQYDPAGRNNKIDVPRTVVPEDSVPDDFPFQNQAGAPLGTVLTSEPFIVSGINVPTFITVAGGRYSKNGGPFTDREGSVEPGDAIVARHRSADTTLTATVTRLNIGGVTARFRTVTEAPDTTPDAFTFPPIEDAPLSTQQVSAPITVKGINQPTPISIEGGQYRINDQAFTANAGTVSAGDTVTVRRKSSSEGSTTVTATLTIGDVSADFDVTTVVVADQSPDKFTFASQTGVPVSSLRVSNAITVQGINTTTPISVDKGQYRVNGGSFTSASGTVEPGDTVIVQQTSAASPSTSRTTTLTIGDRSGTFTTTTVAPDTHPNPFTFVAQNGVPLDSLRTSNAIVVGGINTSVDIGVTGGEYSVNNLPYTASGGKVKAGDFVRVRHTSASTPATTVTTTLSIGDVSGAFRSTTAP